MAKNLDHLLPFVSNLDRPVFAITGLPEEVIAVLLAYYSRSRDDLRTNLARLIDDEILDLQSNDASTTKSANPANRAQQAQQKAREFHQKWVVGYGHSSVAEHAVVHLAVEQVSIIASKAIEDLRLGSYTEKSTRYVRFDTNSFVDLEYLPNELRNTYHATCQNLFSTYLNLFDVALPRVEKILTSTKENATVADATNTKIVSAAAVRSRTCDLLRGLLPAATQTNLGLTVNARALSSLLCKMLSSPLREVQSIATQMQSEATTIVPTLLRHVAPSEFRRQTVFTQHTESSTLTPPPAASTNNGNSSLYKNTSDISSQSQYPPVRIVRYDHDALARIVLALTYDEPTELNAQTRIDNLSAKAEESPESLVQIISNIMRLRGDYEGAPRAFEACNITVELELDYGAYRDLQRHRMLSPATQLLGCQHGPLLSKELEYVGIRDEFERAVDGARSAWQAIVQHDPYAAQYVVPLCYRVRTLWTLNLREAVYVMELRSRPQGHPTYRHVAQRLYEQICKVYPWLSQMVRVDMSPPVLW